MPSTFAELYSDFTDSIKTYTEKLDVTPLSFMRLFTRAIQLFQRETMYIERYVVIPYNLVDQRFDTPTDMLLCVQVKDSDANTMIINEYTQFSRNEEKDYLGYVETPTDYSMRLPETARMVSVWQRVFYFYPAYPVDPTDATATLLVHYIPDMDAFSSNSIQWASWYPIDTNFDTQFRTAVLTASFAPYEYCFMQWAISAYLKSQGLLNHAKMFEQDFWADVERAKANKPVLFHEGVKSYMMAPYS
jgi:hypothetical protein